MAVSMSVRGTERSPHRHAGESFACEMRQCFVPDVIRVCRSGRWRRVDRRQKAGEWGKFVHGSGHLVYDIDDGRDAGPGVPTGIVPSEEDVANRLRALALAPGMNIAEVGTDTGWTAALLDHRLRGGKVVTVADSERLAQLAQERLHRYPRVHVIQKAALFPDSFHRLLSHRAVCRVPWEWVRAVRPGGRLVVPVLTSLGGPSTLLVLTVAEDGRRATGRFQTGPVPAVLWLRAQRPGEGEPVDSREVPRRSSTRRAETYLQQPCRLFCGLLRPDLAMTVERGTPSLDGAAADRLRLHDHQRSRAVVLLGPQYLYEWGPRDLGAGLAGALDQWHDAGEPTVGQLGLTVTEASHTLWVGTPAGPSWALPVSPTREG
ncbi:methyltransferase [Streptomyces griseoviridis]|uniref:protein-L-isoaspartate O-methyltransferase family protein n=1 Tax=Streptomyces griseoviridis TaxID=45398 RepID=UPI00344E4007